LDENWQKENLKKTKEVLTEHFERRKQERMFKEMFRDVNRSSLSTLTPIHSSNSWDTDAELSDFYDKLIWDIADDDDWGKPMEKKPFFKKLKDNIVLAYYDFLLILWRIKQKKKCKK
jgi:hypothetical protein